ncbi:MAG TPA: glutathione S-transferase family protein [Bradyrhizobium sp.]
MALTLHFHPLSSFCWKALIALYENDTPFTPNQVNLGDPIERAALVKLWPIGKFPVLTDDARQAAVAESSIIIEYLDRHYPGQTRFLSADRNLALDTRLRDRFLDLYVHLPMQKIVGDRLRPAGVRDAHGVAEAKAQLQTSYAMIETQMAAGGWAMGADFSLADCAAAPSLFYANKVEPSGAFKNISAYLERLQARPSFARVLDEAEPYFQFFPKEAD